jgi:sugar lactone lactonase YvrE
VGRPLARFEGLRGPSAIAFAPDGTLLVAETGGGRVLRLALEARGARPRASGGGR